MQRFNAILLHESFGSDDDPDLWPISFFRLDALALSVIATATWLAGWWLSHSGIVSKPLNLSENFFDHLKAPSL